MVLSKYLRVLDGPCNHQLENPALTFPFEPDHFQKHSFNCISNHENVLITAHTGSGKTVPAEYAIAATVLLGKKVVYTSPIKALSNQKFKEFEISIGTNFSATIGRPVTIGLMTGDNKMNPNADVVVMTTEILRNALYNIGTVDTKKEVYFEENFIDQIGCVIFDEVHYINDFDRGHVWEETINLLDPNILLVMLSATIDKAEEFASWIGDTKQRPINLIPTMKRVVPLEHYIYVDRQLFKIQDNNNKFFDDKVDTALKAYNALQKQRKSNASNMYMISELVNFMVEKDMLQAIFFSFSRKNCELYAKMISQSLISYEERAEVHNIFNKYMHKYESQYSHLAQYALVKTLMDKGISFHHSGLLPILKEIIEILFQKGLVKVLFATETFAVGVNMPTRTIIFTETEKFTGTGKRLLMPAEYKQMSGRAGRRGLDKFGNVIIMPLYDFPFKNDLKEIMLGKVPHIESKFYINYAFILKIIQSNATNLNQFLSGSMFNKDNARMISQMEQELASVVEKRDIMMEGVSKMDPLTISLFEKYDEFENKKTEFGNVIAVKLSNKQMKERAAVEQQIQTKYKGEFQRYSDYKQLDQTVDKIVKDIDSMKSYVLQETKMIVSLLHDFGYISTDEVDPNKIGATGVSMKGVIAAQINECNPLLLTEMIVRNLFDDLTPCEIVALIGIFIDDVKSDERRTFKDIRCSDKVVDRIATVRNIIDEFLEKEDSCGLTTGYDFWNIYYDYVDVGYMWANNSSIHDVFSVIDTYEGNFIRSVLKMHNIVHDVLCLTKVYGNLKIVPILEKIESMLLRDIVMVNSLYLEN